MKWMKMKTHLAPTFMREIDHVTKLYISKTIYSHQIDLIKEIHEENNYEKNIKYSELRESIIERIDEIDKYYELNFDQPYINHFEIGRIKLKKLLMYEPEIFKQYDNQKEQEQDQEEAKKENEEKENVYNNEEEEIIKKNRNGNCNVNTESQKRSPIKSNQLNKPIMTPIINKTANNNPSKGLKTKHNLKSKGLSINPTQNQKQGLSTDQKQYDLRNKKQVPNSEITLQHYTENNTGREYDFNYNNNEMHENMNKEHQILNDNDTDNCLNNDPNRKDNIQDFEWNNDNDNNNDDVFHEGDIIESNNDLRMNSKGDYHYNNNSISKDKQRNVHSNKSNNECNQNESYSNKPSSKRVIKNETTSNKKTNLKEIESNKSKKDIRNNPSDSMISCNPDNLKTLTEREPRELMIKFLLTEEEYGQLVEVKSKMIMKYLSNSNKKK